MNNVLDESKVGNCISTIVNVVRVFGLSVNRNHCVINSTMNHPKRHGNVSLSQYTYCLSDKIYLPEGPIALALQIVETMYAQRQAGKADKKVEEEVENMLIKGMTKQELRT